MSATIHQIEGNTPEINHPTLDSLKDELAIARNAVTMAGKVVKDIENQILSHPDCSIIKEEGTTNIGQLKFASGYTRKWNQVGLAEMAEQVKPEFFPFSIEYKENKKKSDVMAEAFPEMWEKLSEHLTLTPKKISISIVPPKG